jgi:uncharacterized protein YbjQ (UPF0145 family)
VPPTDGTAGAASARPGAWGSVLTAQELAAVSSAGFAPVGQVFGAAVYAAGSASGAICPGPPAAGVPVPEPRSPEPGDPGVFAPLVEAMYQSRHAAIDRMAAECAALGGHGVVGVRLARTSYPLGGLAFTAIGTAVRAAGTAAGPAPPARSGVPFTCDVSGQDFARLIIAGWVPVGLVLGIAVRARHDDRVTTRQARVWSRNAEMAGWTELVNQARRDARRGLAEEVGRLGAEGVVTADMRMRVRQRDCPVATGRHDHIVEVTFTGTAIARFSAAQHDQKEHSHTDHGHTDHGHARPAVAVMPLGATAGRPAGAPR